MKKFILAALAASVVATPVLAAPYQGQYDNGRYEQRNNDHDRGNRGQYDRRDDRRFDQGRDYRGYQANRQWKRGDRFDNRYASNYRVISSPRAYRLHDAPRGYRWVQSGNDAVLIGLATGLVAAVLANSIH
ncbi:MAG: hypothetical protein JWR77_807 [Rhizorhabdus sp.]|nr:hypothetical protein [Rhizorhabdus sp.]